MTPLEKCEIMAQRTKEAHEAGTYDSLCVSGEPVFYVAHHEALLPGHIYSEAGVDEFRISKACEYHFDQWFKEEDE